MMRKPKMARALALPAPDTNVYVWFARKKRIGIIERVEAGSVATVRFPNDAGKVVRRVMQWRPDGSVGSSTRAFAFPIADDGHTAVRPGGAE